MPFRSYCRDQMWLLPPSLEDLLPEDHPARFVAAFVDELDLDEIGIQAVPRELGAPAFHPRLLLNCWLHGFMEGKRSTRALERACSDTIPYMWLTGLQKPDHITLWRFYKANRGAMRKLFKRTVKLAVRVGLVDFAVQAVDGTKVAVSSRGNLRALKALQKLLQRVEEEIEAIEKENEELFSQGKRASRQPLVKKEELRERIRKAMRQVEEEEQQEAEDASKGSKRKKVASVTDPEARLMPGRRGWRLGYNAQVAVDSRHQIIVAADVTDQTVDTYQLIPLLEQGKKTTGRYADTTLADCGYYSGENLKGAEEHTDLLIPDPRLKQIVNGPKEWPYHKDHFQYHAETDTYTCPQGRRLTFSHTTKSRSKRYDMYVYRCRECTGCSCREECSQARDGRTIHISSYESIIRTHSEKMELEQSRNLYKIRAPLVEGTFGTIKEHLRAHRLLLRGLQNVCAEWHLLCTASNLRKLHKYWWRSQQVGQLSTA